MAANNAREFGVTVDEKGTAIDVRKAKRNLTVKIDVDISEALTGLKALQREAKKATQVLRELEELISK
ncbi:hypothetical protein MHI39_20235 [Heyndrickxia sp. FSL K6-6286]|uniref:hypothetical protein n=1 Tax=Heyndrickxia sp. FSL K6-6286 TaxID=2921510 RepID=UPI00315A41E9